MREIKFRAYGPTGMTFFDNEQAAHDQYIAHHLMLMMANKHPQGKDLLMQYTGLKDKNGVEIYEGDIISAPHDFGPAGFSERKFKVHFSQELGSYQWNYWLMESAEVIGNIHENPELLENTTGDKE